MGRANPAIGRGQLTIAAFAALTVLLALLASPAPALAACPNEAIRAAQGSSFLPDCRAYELVSPPGAIVTEERVLAFPAAENGEAVAWRSYPPVVSSEHPGTYGTTFRSVRSTSGWLTEPVIPPESTDDSVYIACTGGMYFSPNLTSGILQNGEASDGLEQEHATHHDGEYAFCGSNDPPLVEDEPEGFQNLFLLQSFTEPSYQLINVTPPGVVPRSAYLMAASRDLSRVVFGEEAKLTPEAPAGFDLYEWAAGKVQLVTYLPNGTPVAGFLANGLLGRPEETLGSPSKDTAAATNAVSADGSRVFFTYKHKLYVRENPSEPQSKLGEHGECLEPSRACTVQIDASQTGGEGGGGIFLWANAEGTRVFFADSPSAELTTDTQPNSGLNLYEFELPPGATSGKVVDLTPYKTVNLLGISGISENGSRVYFAAEGTLETAGAKEGEPNLFFLETETAGAKPVFIATVERAKPGFPSPYARIFTPEFRTAENELERIEVEEADELGAEVSANGRYFAFDTALSLTGFNNKDALTGKPDAEIFLYDSLTRTLACASCGSVQPTGPAEVGPMWPSMYQPNLQQPWRLKRQLTDNGTVFFETTTPLVSRAVNHASNVYEYHEGEIHLLSSGTDPAGAFFLEASADGSNVFFVEKEEALVPDAEGDGMPAIYDARVDGGFAERSTAAAECSGEACRGQAPGAPVFAPPASATFSGPGNQPAAGRTSQVGRPGTGPHAARKRKLKLVERRCTRRFRHNRKRLARCLKQARRNSKAARARHRHRGRLRRHNQRRAGGAR